MKHSILFTLSFLLIAINALCQDRAISGQVVETGSGEPLPFATVVIKGTTTGTTTNVDGYFTLFGAPQGDVALIVNYVGYQPREIVVSKDQTRISQIELTPASSLLEEVVVSAESFKIMNTVSGISQTTLSTKQLSLLPSIGETDIFRSLQLLPGVSGTNENNSGLFVRGGTPDQNLVLFDGMTVYNVDHFFGFFSAFNVNAVKDVKLYKGAFPAKYGGRISSVVELTGKSGSFQDLEAGGSINLISANGYFSAPVTKNLSVLFTARRSYTDIMRSGVFTAITDNILGTDPIEDLNEQDNIEVNTVVPDFYFYDWNGKVSYRPTDKDILTFSIYQGEDFLDESRDIDIEFDGGDLFLVDISIADKTNWGNEGGSIKWSRQWDAKLYSNFLFTGSRYFSSYRRDASLDLYNLTQDSTLLGGGTQVTVENNEVEDISAKLDMEWQPNQYYKLDFGASFTNTAVDYENVRDDTVNILVVNDKANYFTGYLSNEITLNNLKMIAGLRLTDYEKRDNLLIEPRLSLQYQLTTEWKAKAALGRHYQFVTRVINENITEGSRDFWLLADEELVKTNLADHYVMGLTYEKNNWVVDIESYYKDLSGLSEFSLRFNNGPDINVDQLFFSGDGTTRGLDFLVQKKQGSYVGWVAYTLSRVIHNFRDLNDGNEFPALHDQLHEFKTVHSIELGQWVLSGNFVYGSGKPYSEPSGQYNITLLDGQELSFVGIGPKNANRLPAYHRMDVSVHYRFPMGKSKADLGLSFFNVYNRNNVWYIEYDFTQTPAVISEIQYLGFTPNLSFKVDF